MCGITGVLSKNSFDASVIKSMSQSLSHRGPDAEGVFFNDSHTIGLGHRRLSIIDISIEANQPFRSQNGRYTIVYNGEVYNFKSLREQLEQLNVHFRTRSDTEVIIEAFGVWGTSFVEKLQGMFAFAIWDEVDQKLFLFRDRLGKKPLYYFHSQSLFAFGSEIKALLQHPGIDQEKKKNKKIIGTYLHLGYIPEPQTIYSNIFKFPAGHSGEIDRTLNLVMKPYWRIQDNLGLPRVFSVSDAKKQMNVLLDEAVQKRLISDVPIGAFLSGGTDSSLITALAMKHVSKPLKTYTIGFKEIAFDERKFAKKTAAYLKTDHTEYILSESEVRDHLEIFLNHFDEPFADTSAIPTMLISKLAGQEIKVALTGDGGDELFQGYGSYRWANRLDSWWWKLFRTPMRLALNTSGQSRYQRVAHLLESVTTGGIRSHIFSQEQYLLSQIEVQELMHSAKDFVVFDYDESYLPEKIFSPGEKQALFDLQFYLKDDLLTKVDRASMYYGLECRCPLLDHQVVDYAFSLDHSLKIRKGSSKWLLKQLLYEHIAKELMERPKWGFSIPLVKWLKGDLRYLIDDYLNDDLIEEVGLLDKSYIRRLTREFLAGKDYLYNRLWAIIVLHKWWQDHA